MTEEQLLADRTQLAFEQWPTLSAAYGCMNCEGLFRAPTPAARCPHCGSESIFNAAAALASERTTVQRSTHAAALETARRMIELLDEVCGGASPVAALPFER